MLTLNQWQAVSPYLDRALDMTSDERSEWLAALRSENPLLTRQLESLLREHAVLSKAGFLEKNYLPRPGLAGQIIGAYRLVSQIGQGGMGSVWLAERSDGRFERRVAVKLLNIALMGKIGEERFKREGNILGHLAHPHIAHLIDAGVSESGQPYLVLEHVEGAHIDTYCDENKLTVEARIRLFLDVLGAVAKAHASLIVHRDLKPSNVLVRCDGKAKLLDFGIAKLLDGEGQAALPTRLTVEGGRAMTPEYAAPEQLTGDAVATSTDVYALGVLLYVLLTGRHPAGDGPHTPANLIKAVVENEPPRPSDVVVSSRSAIEIAVANAADRSTTPEKLHRLLRGDLDTILAKTLKKDPAERYASVSEFVDDLRHYLRDEPITARPDTLTYRAAKFVRRNRTAVALATFAIIATSTGIVGTVIQTRTARLQRDLALAQVARTESIADLDNFLLADAAPSGKPFTVNELLTRAEHIAQRQHANLAERAQLLTSIGHKYLAQDEDGKARELLEQAYQLTRELSDPSSRGGAACTLGAVLGRSDIPRAKSLIQEGLHELPGEPQFALDRIACLISGSSVSRESGESHEAIAQSLGARDLLATSPLRSEIMDLRVEMSLAESYRCAGDYRNAIAAFERASALMTALGRDDTETAGTMLNNWALTLHASGHPLDAEKLFRRAIEISRTGSDSEEGVSPMLLVNYARTLRELGRDRDASDYVERGFTRALKSGNQVVINQSLLLRARIYRDRGELSRSEAMLSEVEPRLHASLPPGHNAFAVLALEKSLLAQAGGDFPSALQLVNQALDITDASIKSGNGGRDFVPLLLTARSDIELQFGQPENAFVDATTAVSSLQKSAPGTLTNSLGHAYYSLGRALVTLNRHEEARTAFRSAAENFQATIGADHPDTRCSRQLSES